MKATYKLPCNIAQTLNIIGDRWTLLVVHEILIGNTTFNEIKKALDGISSNLLSDRLKYLEDTGIVSSALYSNHPPRYEYTLTQSGKELEDVFNAIIIWGTSNLEKCHKKLIHQKCNYEVNIMYHCSHCNETVDDLAVIAVED